MNSDKIKCRLYVDAALGSQASIDLDGDQAHYLRSVLRARPGNSLVLFNAADGDWLAHLASVQKSRAEAVCIRQITPPRPSPDVWLCFAPIKKSALDLVVTKATELGVGRLKPVITRHTDVSRVNLERMTANAREAAEQCERSDIPAVDPPVDLPALLADWTPERRLLACVERHATLPLAQTCMQTPPPAAILTGPEGGFAPDELDALSKLPFVLQIDLGPRIVRAETAALAALACWQACAGDWSADRGRITGSASAQTIDG